MADPNIKELLMSRHPTYDKTAWDFYWASYTGGSDFHRYLHTHKKEDASIFEGRQARAYYFNYVKSLLRQIVDFVFESGEITRNPQDDDFSKNVDLKGTTLDDFMSQAALRAIARGGHYIAVDMPNPEKPPENRAEEEASGIRPYWYHIERQDMLNWELDEYGAPLWVLFKDYPKPEADPFKSIKRGKKVYFKLWTRDEWKQFSCDVDAINRVSRFELMADGPNDLGKIPIVAMYGDFDCEWDGKSWLIDIAHIAKALMNTSSLRDNYMYETAIEQLVLPGTTPQEVKDFLRGERYVITCPGEGNLPFVVSPTGKAAEILQMQEKDLRDTIYQLLSQRITNASAGADGASGVSKQVDFNVSTNTTLSGLADECERVENEIHALSAEYAGESDPTVAEYPDDFNVDALDVAIARAVDAGPVEMPDELRALFTKDIFAKMRRDSMDAKEVKAIQDAIDAHFEDLSALPSAAAIERTPAPIVQVTPTGAVKPGSQMPTGGNKPGLKASAANA